MRSSSALRQNFEDEAEHPHAPKGAAGAAHLLYKRVAEYFPDSSLAPEAAWRAADIRWQLDKLDISTLPSAKEQEAYLRPQLYDGEMKKVMKTFPGGGVAALAAYDLLDNKLCGDWQGLPKCPEMETNLYVKYAQQYPDSPKAPEALYNAVYRQGCCCDHVSRAGGPQAVSGSGKADPGVGTGAQGTVSKDGLCHPRAEHRIFAWRRASPSMEATATEPKGDFLGSCPLSIHGLHMLTL